GAGFEGVDGTAGLVQGAQELDVGGAVVLLDVEHPARLLRDLAQQVRVIPGLLPQSLGTALMQGIQLLLSMVCAISSDGSALTIRHAPTVPPLDPPFQVRSRNGDEHTLGRNAGALEDASSNSREAPYRPRSSATTVRRLLLRGRTPYGCPRGRSGATLSSRPPARLSALQ